MRNSRYGDPQPVLFAPMPPSNRTRTSVSAAIRAASTAPRCRDRVLSALQNQGETGATQDLLARLLGIPLATVCARINELGHMGNVRALTETRLTSANSPGMVFVAAEYVAGRPTERWPTERPNWRARALAAEASLARAQEEVERIRREVRAAQGAS